MIEAIVTLVVSLTISTCAFFASLYYLRYLYLKKQRERNVDTWTADSEVELGKSAFFTIVYVAAALALFFWRLSTL